MIRLPLKIMGTLWERFTQKTMHAAPGFRGLQRRVGLRHEFESHRLRHIATPQSPPFGGLCRFWGLGEPSHLVTLTSSFTTARSLMGSSRLRIALLTCVLHYEQQDLC